MSETLDSGIQFSRFAVEDEAWCVWEWDLAERNLEFIRALTPEYFEHLSEVHFDEAAGVHGNLAAVAIRLGYGQALETFFALVCATLQAPDCVAGWLSKYKVHQLHSLVQKISSGHGFLTKLTLPRMSWGAFANVILSFRLEDPERDRAVKDGFAALWSRFALDFNDEKQSHEYNCIKHGLRIRPGGFSLRMGREDIAGVAAPPERMRLIGASPFGCLMLKPELIGVDKRHFRLRKTSRNWQVENLAHGLMMLSGSVRNVLAFLQIINGTESGAVQFSWPQDLGAFQEPWKRSVGVFSSNFDTQVDEAQIVPMTREEILSVYPPTAERLHGRSPTAAPAKNLAPRGSGVRLPGKRMDRLVFEWDPAKAASNLRRHGVSFEEALTVFMNPSARIHDDPDHSKAESREIIVGHSIDYRLLVVGFTERRDTVRIINARPASSQERHAYEEDAIP